MGDRASSRGLVVLPKNIATTCLLPSSVLFCRIVPFAVFATSLRVDEPGGRLPEGSVGVSVHAH